MYKCIPKKIWKNLADDQNIDLRVNGMCNYGISFNKHLNIEVWNLHTLQDKFKAVQKYESQCKFS